MHVAHVARREDLRTFEDLLDTTGGERARLFDRLTPGEGRLPPRLVSIELPGTHAEASNAPIPGDQD